MPLPKGNGYILLINEKSNHCPSNGNTYSGFFWEVCDLLLWVIRIKKKAHMLIATSTTRMDFRRSAPSGAVHNRPVSPMSSVKAATIGITEETKR